ncbi:heterokaryon incompatibility protein-domain-containing protein [Echria macrotheca]|uniref:Heterokaryon incompatibility protein-domain-containing protein n=1 Tax=Echria macrotheca TaxID=438768 RepID=A0AAJ0F6V1_9PEZI|nr:heterokaryon incompatibility protein-domain-containing protein [Echria macrotheca]
MEQYREYFQLHQELLTVAAEGRIDVVRTLVQRILECGEDGVPSTGGEAEFGFGEAIQKAIAAGHRELVRTILDGITNRHLTQGEFAAVRQAAAAEGCHDIARVLFEKAAAWTYPDDPDPALRPLDVQQPTNAAHKLPESITADGGYCWSCDAMFAPAGVADLRSLGGYSHSTLVDLEESANRGCQLCRVILANFEPSGLPPRDQWSTKKMVFHLCCTRGPEDVLDRWWKWRNAIASAPRRQTIKDCSHICSAIEDADTLVGSLVDDVEVEANHEYQLPVVNIALMAEEGDSLASCFPRIVSFPSNESRSAFELLFAEKARAWLRECRESHPGCKQPRTDGRAASSFLPTRLLKVTRGKDGDEPQVALHATHGYVAAECEYVALSYCWGEPQPNTTRRENLRARLESGIDMETLPRTIQDAARATLALGLGYLWVDAMCIVQDDPTDVKREIWNMGKVYQMATLTLFASAASKASEGFLHLCGRYPELGGKRPLATGRVSGEVSWGAVQTIYSFHHPLDRRAWAMQEHILSPRRLVFSLHEPVWDCNSVARPKTVTASNLRYGLDYTGRDLFGGKPGSSLSAHAKGKFWRDLVSTYTYRRLTNTSDRLNAITGVTNEVCALWNDSHVFGMLRSDLILQLAWRTSAWGSRGVLPDVAPSWSWAHLADTIISFLHCFEEGDWVPDAHIAASSSSGTDIYDRDSRELVLDARMMPANDLDFLVPVVLGLDSLRYTPGGGNFWLDCYDGADVGETPCADSASYRRLGLVVVEETGKWDDCPKQSITLV